MPITEIDAQSFDLTVNTLAAARKQPIVAGDDWELRYQVLDEDGAALSLDGATIVMTVKTSATDAAALVTRTSGVTITGSSPARDQIEIDADQTEEDTTANTGMGWFTLRFGREAADLAALRAASGDPPPVHQFEIRITFGSGAKQTKARGLISFLYGLNA